MRTLGWMLNAGELGQAKIDLAVPVNAASLAAVLEQVRIRVLLNSMAALPD